MLSIYDLYDLYAIFLAIRMHPDYPKNRDVIENVISVLNERSGNYSENQFRRKLRTVAELDTDIYTFTKVNNFYVYFPAFLKNERIYKILIASCEEILDAISKGEIQRISDIADCLHNLPVMIAKNSMKIPKSWKFEEVWHYRSRWNKNFLKKV